MEYKSSEKTLREFGLLFGLAIPLFIGFLIPFIYGHSFKSWTIIVGLPFFILAIIKPKILNKPYNIWMKIGHILGWFNSRLILGLIYLIILQPIALFMRLFNYDPLSTKNKNQKSFRVSTISRSIDLTKPF